MSLEQIQALAAEIEQHEMAVEADAPALPKENEQASPAVERKGARQKLAALREMKAKYAAGQIEDLDSGIQDLNSQILELEESDLRASFVRVSGVSGQSPETSDSESCSSDSAASAINRCLQTGTRLSLSTGDPM